VEFYCIFFLAELRLAVAVEWSLLLVFLTPYLTSRRVSTVLVQSSLSNKNHTRRLLSFVNQLSNSTSDSSEVDVPQYYAYRDADPGYESRPVHEIYLFSESSRLALGSTQLPIRCEPVCSPLGGKAAGRWGCQLARWIVMCLHFPLVPSWRVKGQLYLKLLSRNLISSGELESLNQSIMTPKWIKAHFGPMG
jgi:hypothetical protein